MDGRAFHAQLLRVRFLHVFLECLLYDGWPMILAMVTPLLPNPIDGRIGPWMCGGYDWPRNRLPGTIGSVLRLFAGEINEDGYARKKWCVPCGASTVT